MSILIPSATATCSTLPLRANKKKKSSQLSIGRHKRSGDIRLWLLQPFIVKVIPSISCHKSVGRYHLFLIKDKIGKPLSVFDDASKMISHMNISFLKICS